MLDQKASSLNYLIETSFYEQYFNNNVILKLYLCFHYNL